MDMNDASKDTSILSIPQMIDLSFGPEKLNYNFLHSVLHIMAKKMDLRDTRVQISSDEPDVLPVSTDISTKYFDGFEQYTVTEGGNEHPFRMADCKLQTIDEKDTPSVNTVFKITKFSTRRESNLRDAHRVTFHTSSVTKLPGVLPAAAVEKNLDIDHGLFVELMNTNKKLDKCINEIDELKGKIAQYEMDFAELDRKLCTFESAKQMDSINREFIPDYQTMEEAVQTSMIRQDSGDSYLPIDAETLRNCVTQELDKRFSELGPKLLKLPQMYKNLDGSARQMKLQIAALETQLESVGNYVSLADFEKLRNNSTEMFSDICKMQKHMAEYYDKVQDIISCLRMVKDDLAILRNQCLFSKQIDEHHHRIDMLVDEQMKWSTNFDVINEEMDNLRIIKADREELDYLFKEKADRDELYTFVTLEVFKSVQKDLYNGIVEALEQILRQKLEWQRARADLAAMLEEKSDKATDAETRSYINEKFEKIQNQIREVIETYLDRKPAAAVNVHQPNKPQCIVCSRNADIHKEQILVPHIQPIVRHMRTSPRPQPISSRYCGGKHTAVTQSGRVPSRHRVFQQTPSFGQYSPKMGQGSDGVMYRIYDHHTALNEAFTLRNGHNPK